MYAACATGCADLEGIPSEERLAGDGSTSTDDAQSAAADATLPGVSRPDASFASSDAAGVLPDATAADGGGPDCAAPFSADWAAWPMPNGAQDVEAGSPNPERYTDHVDGTITDDVTGLTWMKTPLPGTFAWQDAQNACVLLTLGGASWRLPSYIELASIVEYGSSSPAVNQAYFPGTPMDSFWSATRVVDPTQSSTHAYCVDFTVGATFYDFASNSHYARCVRNDPSP
jgi:hypothetical protein